MIFKKCDNERFDETVDLYHRVVRDLRATINYPKWGVHHPSMEDLTAAFENGELYICIDNGSDPADGNASQANDNEDPADSGKVVGAVVLNEDPEGDYEVGDWAVDLKRGEYLVIHLLAIDSKLRNKGIGGFMVDKCIELAAQEGYKAIRLDAVPDNDPAIQLYFSKGFTYAGEKDLHRDIPAIPLFALYERNLD